MKPKQTTLTNHNDVSDLLVAVENAMSYVTDAMDEMTGYAELTDHFGALCDVYDALEVEKDRLESVMSGEYRAQIEEMQREYYRDLI